MGADEAVQQKAAAELSEIGTRAVEPLIASMKAEIEGAIKEEPWADFSVSRAAWALGKIGDLRKRDWAAIAGTSDFFICRGKPGSEPVLVESLKRFGNPMIATAYLNAGNDKLAGAGLEWAKKHGFSRMPGVPGGQDPRWGLSPH